MAVAVSCDRLLLCVAPQPRVPLWIPHDARNASPSSDLVRST